MWILNGNRTELINCNQIQRFCLCIKDDAALLLASVSTETPPITVARYHSQEEAEAALKKLGEALDQQYAVTESTGRSISSKRYGTGYHGHKSKSHGGS